MRIFLTIAAVLTIGISVLSTATNGADAGTASIKSQQASVQVLKQQLTRTMGELQKIKSRRPEAPKREKQGELDEYQARLAKYQAVVGAWEKELQAVTARIDSAKTRLASEEQELAKLQSESSAARRADEEDLRRALEKELDK